MQWPEVQQGCHATSGNSLAFSLARENASIKPLLRVPASKWLASDCLSSTVVQKWWCPKGYSSISGSTRGPGSSAEAFLRVVLYLYCVSIGVVFKQDLGCLFLEAVS